VNAPIETFDVFRVRLPLPQPLRVWGRVLCEREFVFVRAQAGGKTGTGFALSRGMPLDAVITQQLRSSVIGRNAAEPRALWLALRAAARMTSDAGIYMRALSLIDLAVWDLFGHLLGAPLWRVWGGAVSQLPCLAICGYYRAGEDWRAASLDAVRAEAEVLCAAGYTRFKIPAGEDRALDLERVRLLRQIAGPDALIGVDVSGVFDAFKDALDAARAFAAAGVDFFEDPFPAQLSDRAVALSRAAETRVAFGESITSPELMQRLCIPDGVDWPRPDATVLGGATGFMQAIAPGLGHNAPIFPHYYPDLHAPLAAAFGLPMIEESPSQADTVGFGVLRAVQPDIAAGVWRVSERPGFGVEWDEEALRKFRVQAER
jgi:D-arabinonate dehydratase